MINRVSHHAHYKKRTYDETQGLRRSNASIESLRCKAGSAFWIGPRSRETLVLYRK
jgi:hypothetical protein